MKKPTKLTTKKHERSEIVELDAKRHRKATETQPLDRGRKFRCPPKISSADTTAISAAAATETYDATPPGAAETARSPSPKAAGPTELGMRVRGGHVRIGRDGPLAVAESFRRAAVAPYPKAQQLSTFCSGPWTVHGVSVSVP